VERTGVDRIPLVATPSSHFTTTTTTRTEEGASAAATTKTGTIFTGTLGSVYQGTQAIHHIPTLIWRIFVNTPVTRLGCCCRPRQPQPQPRAQLCKWYHVCVIFASCIKKRCIPWDYAYGGRPQHTNSQQQHRIRRQQQQHFAILIRPWRICFVSFLDRV